MEEPGGDELGICRSLLPDRRDGIYSIGVLNKRTKNMILDQAGFLSHTPCKIHMLGLKPSLNPFSVVITEKPQTGLFIKKKRFILFVVPEV